MENANLAPGHLFNLTQVKVVNEVKVTSRSRSYQGQIVRVWISISKREVGLRLKGILVIGVKLSGFNKENQSFWSLS